MISLNLKLIVVSFLLILIDSRGLLTPVKDRLLIFSTPFEESFNAASRAVSSEVRFWSDFFSLRAENEKLKSKIDELESQILRLKDSTREIDLLRSRVGVNGTPSHQKLVLTRVVGRLSGSPTLVVINQGSKQGLKKGNLVIYKDYIFGRVAEVSSERSRVRLVTDAENFFDGMDIDSRNAKGEVRGSFGTSLKMEKILPTETLNIGDTVIEKGSGYILGKVAKVENEGADILKTADLTLPYELEKVEKVFVLPEQF